MNVYDATEILAKAIKSSKEYRNYVQKQKKVNNNRKAKQMLEDYRKRAMKVQMAQMSGEKVEKLTLDKIKKLEDILMADPILNDYFKAELDLSKMMSNVYKILGESIEMDGKR